MLAPRNVTTCAIRSLVTIDTPKAATWNAAVLRGAVLLDDDSEALRAFVDRHAVCAINMDVRGLLGFVNDGVYMNLRQVQSRRAGAPERGWSAEMVSEATQELLRIGWGPAFVPRTNMDHAMGSADRVYGYLYAGGPGATSYGPYCVILKSPAESGPEPILLASDSLQLSGRYFYMGGYREVDACKLVSELATWDARGTLVASKLMTFPRIMRADRASWPTLIASGAEYIEAWLPGPIALPDVKRILVSDEMWETDWAPGSRATMTEDESKALGDRLRALALLRRHGIPMGPVSDYTVGQDDQI